MGDRMIVTEIQKNMKEVIRVSVGLITVWGL